MWLHGLLLRCAPGRAQARNQTLAVTKHLGIDQPQHRHAARFEIARFVEVQPPARLRAVITAIDFNRQLDRRKIEIDDPVPHRPLALELASKRTAAKPIEHFFQRSFGRRRFMHAHFRFIQRHGLIGGRAHSSIIMDICIVYPMCHRTRWPGRNRVQTAGHRLGAGQRALYPSTSTPPAATSPAPETPPAPPATRSRHRGTASPRERFFAAAHPGSGSAPQTR